jgi:predicted pore-forming effector associated with SMODS systems
MPHPYITDSDERKLVTFLLAIIATGVAVLASLLLKVIRLEVPTWVDGPSIFSLFGLFYAAFKKWLWRSTALHKIGLVKVPSLEGRWRGHILTSFDSRNGKRDIDVVISQDWTDMSIRLKGTHSKSRSCVASLLVRDGVQLAYEYVNEPTPDAVETMHTHRGYTRLDLSPDGTSLDGEYYSGRDRQNIGTIHLARQ